MAVGTVLPYPEKGWLRLDDTDPSIVYVGTWAHLEAYGWYNGTRTYSSSAVAAKFSVNFYGNGIRIIGCTDRDSKIIRVNIDGASEGFVNVPLTPEGQLLTVIYEKTNLSPGYHQCTVDYSYGWAQFDAIDIYRPIFYLYQKDGNVYGMQNGVFAKLADDWSALSDTEKKALFASTNYETPTTADLATLGRFKVLMYSEDDEQQTLSLTAVPHDQLVMPKGLISIASFDGIDKATLANTVAGNGACQLIVTTDGAAYQTYDFTAQAWQPIDHTDLAAIKADGIDAAQLANIDRAAWDALTTEKAGIGFAYLLSIEATTDQCAVDRLDLQVDMRGSWDRAIHGTDYRYGYPANNVLRVSLLADGDYKINYAG